MVRPKAPVLLQQTDGDAEVEIMMAYAVWIVVYQNAAISATRRTWAGKGQVIKYLRTNFSNRAHAYRLADRLNKMFDTEDFSVREVNI